ncbi:hypothetical protein EE612_046411 [Oryza sativa]|nr:hypothetical protein EE612_046411 [Oryza sativa]
MVSPDLIRNMVGIVGNIISFGLFLSPVPTFYGSSRIRTCRTSRRTRTWPRCSTACSGFSMVSLSSTPTAFLSSPSTALALSSRLSTLPSYSSSPTRRTKRRWEWCSLRRLSSWRR